MTAGDKLSAAVRMSGSAFLPVRRVAGPLHRRREVLKGNPNDHLAPLAPPWDDERWFRDGFPPRRHNAVEPLLHGEEFFRKLHDDLLSARERVTIAGWCLTPLMPLLRGSEEEASVLAKVLHHVSSHAEVCVLLWSGAPALFQPTEQMVKDVQRTLLRIAPRVRCEMDYSAPFSHDHHQKAVTIDGRVAYLGGMDLCTFQGDRWDTYEHRLRFGPNWHDVQVRLQGEVVQDVEENFCQRWNAVTGEHLGALPAASSDDTFNTPVQIVRTIPAGFYPFAPKGEHGIYHALTTAIRKAEHFVYLENQYIWAPEIVQALVDAMQRPRSCPFRVILVLPARALMGRYDNDEHVRDLSDLDAGRGIFHAFSLYSGGPAESPTGYRYLPIYVHAKVSVVDDEWFSIGSANLNQRGLSTDSEINVQGIDPDVARSLRVRLWAEHLGLTEEEVSASDPIALVEEWQRAAKVLEERIRSSEIPPAGHVRTYVPGRNPGSRLLDVLQGITLEH